MTDLNKALADLADIRVRLAAGTLFQGFGPAAVAVTGAIAFVAGAAQAIWPGSLSGTPEVFFTIWIGVAVAAAVLIGVEMVARSRRRHGGLSTSMILNAVEQFLPAGFAGAVIAAVIAWYAPDCDWMLPGLWQILVALGIFAASRSLPRTVTLAGAWYFLAGAAVFMLAAEDRSLSPWMMALPFGIGQSLIAAILHFAEGDSDG